MGFFEGAIEVGKAAINGDAGLIVQALKAILAGNWIELGLIGYTFFAPNKWLRANGRVIGRILSKLFRQKIGKKNGEEIESRLQGSIGALFKGINEGMDEDDKI